MTLYHVFHRTWWCKNPQWPGGREPSAGKKQYIAKHVTREEALKLCKQWNEQHEPGYLSDKAEFEEA
jgi:hypothetical protein